MDRKIVQCLREGKTGREICRDLKVGDRRLSKVKALAEAYGYLDLATVLPPFPLALFPDGPDGRSKRGSEVDDILFTRKDWICERLAAGWHPITVFEEIGIAVTRSSFYRFLHRHGLYGLGENARPRVVPEIVHKPGEALLLDWGKLRDVKDEQTGKKRILWAFVGVLGYSRYMMVHLVWSNSTTETTMAIEGMLREIGGVPSRVTSDNPKCFAIEASRYEPLLNPTFERLAGHYGFNIECLPPADPQKKGKVERPMKYVRRLYEAHGQAWHGLEESQAYIDRKLVLANERKHGTTGVKPIEQFLEIEAKSLKPLPAISYTPEEVAEGQVRRDGHVRFANKYYSCEEKLIGEQVMILASLDQVTIYHKGQVIEVHQRIPASDVLRSKSTKLNHLKPWEREMQDNSIYRKRAKAMGPHVDKMILYLLERGQGFIDTRKIWGILSFDKTYSAAQIDAACAQAIELQSYSYRMVKSLLILAVEPQAATAADTPTSATAKAVQTNKFARPMSVYEEQLKLKLH